MGRVYSGRIITREVHETIKFEVAVFERHCFENDWYSLIQFRKFKVSVVQNVSETRVTVATWLHFGCLNHSYSIFKILLKTLIIYKQ